MIKVAMVSTIRPQTNYTAYLIEALQKYYGKEVEVLVYTETENPEENLKIPLTNINLVWDRNWKFIYQILRRALRDKVQIIHFQHEINMYGGPRTAVLFPFLVFLSRILGFKPAVTVHAAVEIRLLNEEFLRVFEWPRPEIFSHLVRIIFPTIYFFIGLFAKKVIVHSLGLKEILERDYHFNGKKIVVIPHGVPENIGYRESDVSRRAREMVEGKKFILYFGYLHRRKGLEYLIDSFKKVCEKHPDLLLVLAGGTTLPNYVRELESQVKSLNLSGSIFITGFLGLNDLRYLLSGCEFVVLPAVYSIAASGPLAQVFAHGKAVIVSDLGVYREEIENGVNGLLAKAADADNLANQMERLMVDVLLRRKIESGAQSIRRRRSWEYIAGSTLRVYQSL
ncbi:MAG: glycosyltransferase family 4 protein [Patescibacteria group bacterium]|nr:glycosyltransferase family 4 protein [Patescibacteria group bacterium]